VQAQAERSARRLHGRWQALEARGKPRSIVVVAVARELAGVGCRNSVVCPIWPICSGIEFMHRTGPKGVSGVDSLTIR
jgi:hypothetical protein